jgi:hypothetical protein
MAIAKVSKPSLSVEETVYLIHHLFLPPKLPQQDDNQPELDDALLRVVIDALGEFRQIAADTADDKSVGVDVDSVARVEKAISTLREIRGPGGEVSERKLLAALEQMEKESGESP